MSDTQIRLKTTNFHSLIVALILFLLSPVSLATHSNTACDLYFAQVSLYSSQLRADLELEGESIRVLSINEDQILWTSNQLDSFSWYAAYVSPLLWRDVLLMLERADFGNLSNELQNAVEPQANEQRVPVVVEKRGQRSQRSSGKLVVRIDRLFISYLSRFLLTAKSSYFDSQEDSPKRDREAVRLMKQFNMLDEEIGSVEEQHFSRSLKEQLTQKLITGRDAPKVARDQGEYFYIEIPKSLEIKIGQIAPPLPSGYQWRVKAVDFDKQMVRLERVETHSGYNKIL